MQPLDARFLGRKHADRLVAQGSKAAFEQADGVDGSKRCLRLPKPPPYLARNGLMRQGIEGRKLRRIGKHDGGQRRAVDPAVPDRAGKARADGGDKGIVRLEQAMINRRRSRDRGRPAALRRAAASFSRCRFRR